MSRIAIIIGSTRPGRVGPAVADWVLTQTANRTATYELVDLADFALPVYDEPNPAALGIYEKEHTRRWAEVIDAYDGFVFVTPEYNHGVPSALKNAIDFLYAEWNHKAAAFVSYGAAGGVRAVEQIRLIAAEVQLATVAAQVTLPIEVDFPSYPGFSPAPSRAAALERLFGQLELWSDALAPVRSVAAVA
ncbi:NADPH-dependent FMN reductase [Occultella kanbiaonis]|uniref:NADPH-dependent FMN reductase n=1 Tax=Occultella kanbiaonis TaxID=2675754 RepID=UPI0012B756CC|nr:NAD(P)H-dependent oxidoreductase [Occultella kanbiaonis]